MGTTLARGRLLSRSPLETSPDLSLDLLPLLSGGLPRSPTRVSSPTTSARGRLLSRSPLETSPDLSLDLLLLLSGGLPRSPTRVSSPTTLARDRQFTQLVFLPQPAPTTPSATSPPWCPLGTSTLLVTLPVSALLS